MLHSWPTVTYFDDECYIWRQVLLICTRSVTYPDNSDISTRWVLHMLTTVTYLDDECYISGRQLQFWRWMLHSWTTVTYLRDEWYISGRHLHIFTMNFTYFDDEYYISGRLLHITMMGVIFLDDCYIYGRWVLHILKAVIYLDSNISTRHTSQGHAVLMDWMTLARVPVHFKGMREIARA